MTALLALIILISIMFIMAACLYAQWQIMKLVRERQGIAAIINMLEKGE